MSKVIVMPSMPARLPVVDGEQFVCWVSEERAREMLKHGEVDLLRTKKKVRALKVRHAGRLFTVSPSTGANSGPSRTNGSQLGKPHKRENYYNVRGVWHIDRIPPSQRSLFTKVLDSCLKAA